MWQPQYREQLCVVESLARGTAQPILVLYALRRLVVTRGIAGAVPAPSFLRA